VSNGKNYYYEKCENFKPKRTAAVSRGFLRQHGFLVKQSTKHAKIQARFCLTPLSSRRPPHTHITF